MKRMPPYLILFVAGISLYGCAKEKDRGQFDSQWKADVQEKEVSMLLNFEEGKTFLSPTERLKLQNSLLKINHKKPLFVEILFTHQREDEKFNHKRILNIILYLKDLGIPRENIETVTLKRTDPEYLIHPLRNAIRVKYMQYMISLPQCPGWDMEDLSGPNGALPLGCATMANLARMVAHPRDLIRGRELGPSPGEREVESVRRYRTDQIKEPEKIRIEDAIPQTNSLDRTN